MNFLHVALLAGNDCVADLEAFYARGLGLPTRPELPTPPGLPTPPELPTPPGLPTPPELPTPPGLPTPPELPTPPGLPTPPELPTRAAGGAFTVTAGETELTFTPAPGEPFYHFALLVPGDRFDAALTWIRERVALLPHWASADVVFDFPGWNAQACYFHDPAGNIVELIAHQDREATGASGPFDASELLGLSELGLVGTPTAMAPPLTEGLGLRVWDGRVANHDALAFVGEPARTLILVPTARGWLPTGRPAERHPITVAISGVSEPEVELEDGLYRVSSRRQRQATDAPAHN